MVASCVQGRALSIARVGVIGILAGAFLLANDPAEAARKRYRGAVKKRVVAVRAWAPPSAAIVVDGKTGRVLYERDADELRYPASITKVMTLYVLFEELEARRLTLDSRLTVSSYASLQAPSKLGLRPGSTIRVEDAIGALVTKSANDVAVVVAENISGSEAAFAERMTRKARALGMSRTVYANASGLPNKSQLTTARDLATLGRAIQDRFPRYYAYFSTRVFHYAGRAHGNHNKLLGRVQGVDGIKTGFTNASGFNLITSVHLNGRHIVGVVLGGRSGGSRDATMRELVALNLPKASPGSRTAPLVAEQAVPDAAPVAPRARPAVVAEAATPVAAEGMPKGVTRSTDAASTATPPAIVGSPLKLTTTAQLRPATTMPRPVLAISDPPAADKPLRQVAPQAVAQQPLPPLPPTQPVAAKPALPVPAKQVVTASASAISAPSLRWMVGASPATTGSVDRGAAPTELARSYASEGPTPRPLAAPAAGPVRGIQVASASGVEAVPLSAAAQAIAPTPAPARPTVRPAERIAPTREGWFIQIGATPDEDKARELLSRAQAAARVLKSAEPFTEPVAKDDVTLYRARFAGLDRKSAQSACDALKRADMNCFAIKN